MDNKEVPFHKGDIQSIAFRRHPYVLSHNISIVLETTDQEGPSADTNTNASKKTSLKRKKAQTNAKADTMGKNW